MVVCTGDCPIKKMNTDINQNFWIQIDELVKTHKVVIDRAKGSCHPNFPEIEYPLDYGYLENTKSEDGAGIDVWVGSRPQKTLDAVIITVDLYKRDVEIKLLLGCSQSDIDKVRKIQNEQSLEGLLIPRYLNKGEMFKERRSIRQFLDRQVDQEKINEVLEAAILAPSAHNRQPWRFIVISKPDIKQRLVAMMSVEYQCDLISDGKTASEAKEIVVRSNQKILSAPVVIIICLDSDTIDQYGDEKRDRAEYLTAVQSTAMAGENLLLSAHTEGLGGVWMCAPLFAQEAVRKAIELPDEWDPQGLILLGYPANTPDKRKRKSVDEVSQYL